MKSSPFASIEAMNKLKHRKRKGWVLRGVKNPESVAEHSWRSAAIALAIAPKGYDKGKMAQLGILHDISEIFGEDYTPVDGITSAQKEKLERQALKKFLKLLPADVSKEWEALWEEMENQTSKEAQLVKDAEILEVLFQALEYQKAGNFKQDLTEFWARDIGRLKTPIGKKIGKEIDAAWPKAAKKKFDASKYKYHY